MNPHTLITKLGGYREVAEMVGRSASRVHRWQDEGIPSRAWLDVLAAARTAGVHITMDDLAAMQPAPREKLRRGPRKVAA